MMEACWRFKAFCLLIAVAMLQFQGTLAKRGRDFRKMELNFTTIDIPLESDVYSWTERAVKERREEAAPPMKVVFEDEFDDLDLKVWQPEITLSGGGNWEFEYYTNNRSNCFVKDGVLYIKPTLTASTIGEANVENGFTMDVWGGSPADMCTGNEFYGCERTSGAGGNVLNPIQSAAVRTTTSFSFKYGRVEIKAKLPKGDWIWPAIWMMPTHNQYGQWPASGEIDIMESRGNPSTYTPGGVNKIGSTLHWGPFWPIDDYSVTHAEATAPAGKDFSDDFHTYGMVWNESFIGTYLDTEKQMILSVPIKESFWTKGGFSKMAGVDNPWLGRPNNAPFDREFYFIFNVAVGGTNGYFPDGVGGKPWSDKDPHAINAFWTNRNKWLATWNGDDVALQIDSIKVWQNESKSKTVKL